MKAKKANVFTFTIAVLAIAAIAYCVCEFLNLGFIAEKLSFFIPLIFLVFGYDNSGLRTNFLSLFFKDKIVFGWLQRENSSDDQVSEILKTFIYYLVVIFVFFPIFSVVKFAWIPLVILNVISYFRFIIKNDLFPLSDDLSGETPIKGLIFTVLALIFTPTDSNISAIMLIIVVIVAAILLLSLLLSHLFGKFESDKTILIVALLVLFSFYSVRSANYIWDYKEPNTYESVIFEKKEERGGRHRSTLYYFIIEDWQNPGRKFELRVGPKSYFANDIGDYVKIRQGEGALGGRWYEYDTIQEKEQDNGTQND